MALGASVLLLLALAASASAALSFRFDRGAARPGTTVVASEPGWPKAPLGVTVYLVRTRLPGVKPDPGGAYVLARPPSRYVIRLGRPHVTRAHLLTIRFRVPNVAPGDYTTAFWCRTCTKDGDFFPSTFWGEPWSGEPGTVLRIER